MLFDHLRSQTIRLLEKIYQHPFNQELMKGTLPRHKFTYYLAQDALYLNDYSKALALIASRLGCNEHSQRFLHFASEAIQAEKQLHSNLLEKYGFPEKEYKEQGPFCFLYSNYLLKLATLGTVEEAVAGILPCFWVYQQVGQQALMKSNPNNPYQTWIDLYASPEFDYSVSLAIGVFNDLANDCSQKQKDKMIFAFERAMQLEWYFWQGAYLLETWNTFHINTPLIEKVMS